jgi:hypothetical protein
MTFSSQRRSSRGVPTGSASSAFGVRVGQRAYGAEPVVDQAVPLVSERSRHAAALVVSAHDHVLDVQDVDRELQHGETIEVRVHDEVRDVPMNEDLAGRHADDLVRGHATVGAADPQIVGRLLLRQPPEEVGVTARRVGGPPAVVVEETLERLRHIGVGVHHEASAAGVSRGYVP